MTHLPYARAKYVRIEDAQAGNHRPACAGCRSPNAHHCASDRSGGVPFQAIAGTAEMEFLGLPSMILSE